MERMYNMKDKIEQFIVGVELKIADDKERERLYNLLSEEGKERLNALEKELYELMYDKDGMQRRYTSKHELNKYDLIEAIIKQK